MRKFIPISVVGLLVMALWALPAMAMVNVYADIEKDKNIYVNEYIDIYKLITVQVTVVALPETAAEANALVNQDNLNNLAQGSALDPTNGDVIQDGAGSENLRWNTIVDSIWYNTGIVGVNQDSGNANNQGNAIALAVVDATDVGAFANAQASAEQLNEFNKEWEEEPDVTLRKADYLTNSMNANTGIVSVNQSVGNMNNQANAVAVAAGLVSGDVGGVLVALAESDLGQVNAFNTVIEYATVKLDQIQSSINSNHGVTSFNQSAGNMNNQANIVSIAFSHPQ